VLIIALFLSYSYFGASILKEVETNNNNNNLLFDNFAQNPSSSASSSSSSSHSRSHSSSSPQILKKKKIILSLKDDILSRIEEQFVNSSSDNLTSSHFLHVESNEATILSQFNSFLSKKGFNKSRMASRESQNNSDNSKMIVDLEVIQFMIKLYNSNKNKKTFEASSFFKAIGIYLHQYKETFKLNLTQQLNEFLYEYKQNQLELFKTIMNDIKLNYDSKYEEEVRRAMEESEKMTHLKKNHLSSFLFFTLTQLTTIGKLFKIISFKNRENVTQLSGKRGEKRHG
jgi:hypothetical protein